LGVDVKGFEACQLRVDGIIRRSEPFHSCRWFWNVREGGMDGVIGRIIDEIIEGLLLIGFLHFRTLIGLGPGSSL
jgi:hypothetical protein